MATVAQVGKILSEQLSERVDHLLSAIGEDASDLGEIGTLAEAVGDFADTIAEIYGDLEQTLTRGLRRDREEREPRTEPTRRESGQSGARVEGATKEELLEQARELNIQGRSSMAKEELAQAVEAEESLSKEDLRERARDAGIEGRASMTKEDLREALREAGA